MVGDEIFLMAVKALLSKRGGRSWSPNGKQTAGLKKETSLFFKGFHFSVEYEKACCIDIASKCSLYVVNGPQAAQYWIFPKAPPPLEKILTMLRQVLKVSRYLTYSTVSNKRPAPLAINCGFLYMA